MDLPGRVPRCRAGPGPSEDALGLLLCAPWTVKKERLVGLLLFRVLISPALQIHRKGARPVLARPQLKTKRRQKVFPCKTERGSGSFSSRSFINLADGRTEGDAQAPATTHRWGQPRLPSPTLGAEEGHSHLGVNLTPTVSPAPAVP